MRVGGIMGMSSGYSVFSVYGNPKSIEKVAPVNEETKAASPLVVVKEEPDITKEIEKNIDEVIDYEEIMNQMKGTNPINAYSIPMTEDAGAGYGTGNEQNDISAFLRNKAIMAYS